MGFISYSMLKTTPTDIEFAVAPVDWANKFLAFGYYQPLKEYDFYAVVNSSPNAFDIGEWVKEHSSGEQRFALKSGAYFRVFYYGGLPQFGLYAADNTEIARVEIVGKNGVNNINHSGIFTLYMDSENGLATLGYLRDVRALGTKEWSGNAYILNSISNSEPLSVSVMQTIYNAIVSSIPPKFPWKEDNTETGGGLGKWDDDSTERIDPPNENDLNAAQLTDTFFMQTYRLSKTELQGLGKLLWTPNVTEALSALFKNPLESIINLLILPFDVHRSDYRDIKLGTYNTGIGGFLVDQYTTIDCGVLDVPEKWGGALDYETRILLYLPFIGTKELDITDVIGGQLGIKYLVDVLTGACVAFVAVKRGDLESVLYQFTGNCAYSFPLTQANYNTFYSALLASTATVATGIATGGASTPMLVGAGASVAMSAKTHVNHSGNLAGNTGYMGIKKPYIILSRPIQALPADFGKYKGYQSHITKKLSECKGYTEVEYIHLDGINRATSAELAQIESLLKGGVIIS